MQATDSGKMISRPTMTTSGFTLLELAVVIVLVALIAGAILVGTDLILAARMRGIVSQLRQFDVAVFAFRDKYRGLPGDFAAAQDLGLATSGCPDVYGPGTGSTCMQAAIQEAGCSGNGNGILDNGFGASGALNCPENLSFWYHLSRAGLIGFSADGKSVSTQSATGTPVFGKSAPATVFRDVGMMVVSGSLGLGPGSSGHNMYTLGLADRSEAYPNYTKSLRGAEAGSIDEKLDDGTPSAGRIQVLIPMLSLCAAGGRYDVLSQTTKCGLLINTDALGRQ
ncbi:MAG: type II secretion system protein [Phycisphaerae bacterium]|nr:type II secretion system GspH family protein [Phycisphaerae bacterium]NUQ44827.1 type II secretion system protein [Phycisphaerae bacterium]